MSKHSKRSSQKLHDLLGKYAVCRPILSEIAAANRLRSEWDQRLKRLAKQSYLRYIRNHVAAISVPNAVWQQEFIQVKSMIIRHLSIDDYPIRDIKLTVEPKPEPMVKPHRIKSTDFEQTIRLTNQDRQQRGLTRCTECHLVYSDDDVCSVCQIKLNSSEL